MRNNKGFTLIEIIVAVALVAILSAAIAPSVLNNISQGRMARAQSDVQSIAQSIIRFKSDTGKYPRLPAATLPDTGANRFCFLASSDLKAAAPTTANFPQVASGAVWPTALTTNVATNASCEDFYSHLILGRSRGPTDSLYTRATNPDDPNAVGYKSQLLSSDPLDPWGHRYLCNVKGLGQLGPVVWVISAGPNGVLETVVLTNGTGAAQILAGDDIGFRIQ